MTEIVSDGFGNNWLKCRAKSCDLVVVRPGKEQCSGMCQYVGWPDDPEVSLIIVVKQVIEELRDGAEWYSEPQNQWHQPRIMREAANALEAVLELDSE